MSKAFNSTAELEASYSAMLGGGWREVPSWYEMGLEYYLQGKQTEKVVEYMSRTLENNPCNYYAYYYLASALKKQGKYEKALAVIKERIKRDREDSFNYFFGSIISVDIYLNSQGLKSKGAIEGAQELINEALMLNASDIVYESHRQRIERLLSK